ncbi:unnamed protein product [Schistosoma margrebowiei]|uniref:Tetraspanin n=2 Tax=Schistosoma margrebowiei TaxID=48269 RepID=A0AA84ZS27_9TREM|nr:unnamed protein product [Schistosoma margrebowiei]
MYLSIVGQYSTKLFVFFNCLFITIGSIVVVYGMKLSTNLFGYKRILQATIPPIFLTAIFSGSLGILAACIGILAILSERNMIMYLHLCTLTIVILMEIGIALTSSLMKDQFFTEAHRSLNTNVKQYWTNLRYQIEFDDLQTTFRCCGADSSNDYPHIKQLIPISCLSGIKPYSLGCIDALNEFVQYYKNILIYLCFSFGIIHGIYLMFSVVMVCKSKHGNIRSTQTSC